MNRPNVILLTIDTLRADRLGCYGYQPSLTPNLDRMAKHGVRFNQAITGGSWTQAAFPVMLTSSYASMYGGCLGPLSPERPSPIAVLGECGYETAAFTTSPLLSQTYGYDRDFQHFAYLVPQEKDPILRGMKGGQHLLRTTFFHQLAKLVGLHTRPAKVYDTAANLTDRVRQWISRAQAPFFIWAHYMDVHWPYHLEETLTEPKEIARAWQDLSHMHACSWNQELVSQHQRTHYVKLYEQAVRYTDSEIGKLFDYLGSSGRAEDTIVIAVSDHGEEFLEHGRWGHFESNLYDEILKVPMLIQLPGLNSPQVVERQVRTLDLTPTILDLCDCPVPEGVEGESLVPLWTGQEETYKSRVSTSEMLRDDWHIVAVRTEEFKLIWNSRDPDSLRLYDLRRDPEETANVVEQHPVLVERLLEYVRERRRRMNATMPHERLEEPDLDEELLSRLRSLGYVE